MDNYRLKFHEQKWGLRIFFDQIHITGQLVYNYTSLDLWWIY